MTNRFTVLLAFLAAFMFISPALAQPPEGDAKAEKKADDGKTDEAKAEEKADAKADETKTEEKTDAKADAKTDEKADATGDTDGAKEIETDEEAVSAAQDFATAIGQKHWALALGLGLSLLVFGLRKVKVLAKVPSKALPWVTAALGIVTYVAAALMTDGASITDALWGGAMTGAAAVGLWEMVLKNFLGSKASEGGSAS